jgi:hypothetical protein
MAKIPIQIGARSFQTKTEAKTFARHILTRHADGEVIAGLDDLFLRDLVALHHEASTKIGCGVAHFSAQHDPVWGNTRHFVIVRTDGTSTDVSFHTCIDGSNARRDVFHALRHAIADQVISFQQAAFAGDILPICPYTGEILTISDAHVDHTPPDTFFALATRWMKESSLAVDDIPLVDSCDNQWASEVRDLSQKSSWCVFHKANAHLRIISRAANLSHAKREHPKA